MKKKIIKKTTVNSTKKSTADYNNNKTLYCQYSGLPSITEYEKN